MSRAVGEFAVLEGLPEAVVVLAALATQLGDVWFVFLLLGLAYWFGDELPAPVALDRRRAAFAVALGVGANAATTTLKEWLSYPRPPGADEAVGRELVPALVEPLYTAAATGSGFGFPSGHAVAATVVYGGRRRAAPGADEAVGRELVPALVEPLYVGAATGSGFGFPSGHALAATVVYGGLALLVGGRRAYAGAAAVVAVVSLSRVVLRVHYLVDVVVGIAVGSVFLAAAYGLGGRGSNPGRVFALALIVALFGPVLGAYDFRTMASLGGALGARLAWGVVGGAVVHEKTTRAGGAVSAAVGAAFGGLFGVVYAAEPAPHVAFLAVAVVLGGVLAAPLAGGAVARWVRARRTRLAGTS